MRKSDCELEIIDCTNTTEEWAREMYEDDGINVCIMVWLFDGYLSDEDIPQSLPELERIGLGEIWLDDNGVLALKTDLTIPQIIDILRKRNFNIRGVASQIQNRKITTEDCINAIVDDYIFDTSPKDWRRMSKSGTGNNIIRRFRNIKTGDEVTVKSSEKEIFGVFYE